MIQFLNLVATILTSSSEGTLSVYSSSNSLFSIGVAYPVKKNLFINLFKMDEQIINVIFDPNFTSFDSDLANMNLDKMM